MSIPHRIVNTVGFAAAGAGFLLPFVSVTSGTGVDEASATWQGTDLTVGGKPQLHLGTVEQNWADLDAVAPGASDYFFVSGQFGLIAAAVLILAGVLAAFLTTRLGRTLMAGLSGAGATALIVGNAIVVVQQEPIVNDRYAASFGTGFWFVVGLLAILTATNLAIAAGLSRHVDEPVGTPRVDAEPVEATATTGA